MPYRIVIDRDVCIGAGTCVAEAPRTFDLDEHDLAVVQPGAGDDDQAVLWAAQGCPVGAISLFVGEDDRRVWPEDA